MENMPKHTPSLTAALSVCALAAVVFAAEAVTAQGAPAPAAGTKPSPQQAPVAAPPSAAPAAPASAAPTAPASAAPAAPASAAPAAAPASAKPQPPATAAATPATGGTSLRVPVLRRKLANGLRVVLNPDKTVPTVAIAVYYDVGSRNEQRGRSGFAHLFEHMMFQGSENVGKGEHFQLVMNRGGQVNGTTSHDRTNYFEGLPANDLALGLWLEADRMRSLAITQENFENQRQTVMEERRQSYDNRPYMGSMLRINELAYGDYFPYAHSTIGDMQDLQNAPLSAVQEFFNQYYAPNNAVLSIAGDFDPEQAMQLVQRYFGEIPARNTPAYNPEPLQPQTAERVESMLDPLAELPAFHVAYHIPENRAPDHYPLELLAIVLGDGESSRLYQKLVKGKEVVQEISVETDGRRGPDLFSIWAIVSPGQTGASVRQLIDREIADIAQKGISERELQKAKNRVRSAFVFAIESNLQRAMHLAEFETFYGDAELLNQEADRYLSVTADDVKRVAKQYFAPSGRTVLDVLPAKAAGEEPKADAARPGRRQAASAAHGRTP
jgi:predicted Zn-dependent peptidase